MLLRVVSPAYKTSPFVVNFMYSGLHMFQYCRKQAFKTHFEGSLLLFIFLKILFIYFRERGREGEREGKKHQCVVASNIAPTGDLACNLGVCPDWESNCQALG